MLLLAYLQWLYFYPQKGRVLNAFPQPSPQPLTYYVAHLPELQLQIEKKNTCRSRKQISLICYFMILLLFGNATAHAVGVSLERFEICLSSVVFAEAKDQAVQGL